MGLSLPPDPEAQDLEAAQLMAQLQADPAAFAGEGELAAPASPNEIAIDPSETEFADYGSAHDMDPLGMGEDEPMGLAAPLPGLAGDEALAGEERRQAVMALYGVDFPPALLTDHIDEQDWVRWVQGRWDAHRSGVIRRLHLTEKNRLFRRGQQWIHARGLSPWTEPPKPKESSRVTYNMVDKALDQRLQLLTEQRPGFRARPTTQDPIAFKRAEAQQLALEYQFDAQNMSEVIREAAYWAGTDGVSFLCSYWDPEAGPWFEVSAGREAPMGDIRTMVYRIEQVRVSANATATQKPWYWITRETLPTADAVARYGEKAIEHNRRAGTLNSDDMGSWSGSRLDRLGLVGEHDLLAEQDLTDKYTLYCEPSEYLPKGLMVVVVGDALVYQGPLPCGRVPLVRFTDGSSDPAFYPTPIMEGWLDHQMRINAVLSKWVDSVRLNAGGRILAKPNAISQETLIGGLISLVEVTAADRLQDSVMPMPQFSLANDAKELFALEKKAFEDASGWNDTSRGQMAGDPSGRAILAAREQLERVFTPPIAAASRAMSEWGKLQLAWMRAGYKLPRQLAVLGPGRPDLAREVSAEDFDGASEVEVDPETLMPLPRAYRLHLLDEMLAKQVITPQDYKRRLPFAWVQNMASPDQDHEARANRVCEAIRQSGNPNALPLLWQDNEAIHQDVLERQLILPDDTPQNIRQAAMMRWQMLAQQQMIKANPMMAAGPPVQGPVMDGPAPGGGPGGSQVPQIHATRRPLLSQNSGLASSPAMEQAVASDPELAAKQFEQYQVE